VAVDYRNDWLDSYDKAYLWLKLQFKNDAQLEREVFESAKKFVVERYEVDKDKEVYKVDESFVSAQAEKEKVLAKVHQEEQERLAKIKIGM